MFYVYFLFFLERERDGESSWMISRTWENPAAFPQEPSPAAWASQNHPKNIKRTRFKGQLMMGKHWQNQGLITSICRNLR